MSIKILIDSSSDITKEEAMEMGIEIIPMMITIGDKDYLDGEDLSSSEFYNLLETSKVLPKTSQINPFRFEEAFERLTANGDDVICITLSSKLSGTYASAKSAAQNFNKVHVVDSMSVALGERLLVKYALELISKGLSIEEIIANIENEKSKIKIVAVVDTLEYLKKGGRVSSTAAFAGELLNIKPIVSVVDGEVKMIGKTRGSKKGFSFLDDYVIKNGGIDFDMSFGVLYSGNDMSKLENYINHSKNVWKNKNVEKCKLGCTIGTHVGHGAVGISFFANE